MANPTANLSDNVCFESSNEKIHEGDRRQSLICGILNFDVYSAVSKTESVFKIAVEKITHLTSTFSSSNLFDFGMFQAHPQTDEVIYPKFLSTYYHIRQQIPHYFDKEPAFHEDSLWRFKNNGVMPKSHEVKPAWLIQNHPATSTKSHSVPEENEEFGKDETTFVDWCESRRPPIDCSSSVNPVSISQNPQHCDGAKYPDFLKTFHKDLLPCSVSIGSLTREDYNVLKRRKSEIDTRQDKQMSLKID